MQRKVLISELEKYRREFILAVSSLERIEFRAKSAETKAARLEKENAILKDKVEQISQDYKKKKIELSSKNVEIDNLRLHLREAEVLLRFSDLKQRQIEFLNSSSSDFLFERKTNTNYCGEMPDIEILRRHDKAVDELRARIRKVSTKKREQKENNGGDEKEDIFPSSGQMGVENDEDEDLENISWIDYPPKNISRSRKKKKCREMNEKRVDHDYKWMIKLEEERERNAKALTELRVEHVKDKVKIQRLQKMIEVERNARQQYDEKRTKTKAQRQLVNLEFQKLVEEKKRRKEKEEKEGDVTLAFQVNSQNIPNVKK
eukprot:g5325.t1